MPTPSSEAARAAMAIAGPQDPAPEWATARAEPAAAPTAVQAPAEPAIAPGSGALIDPQAPVAGAPDQRSAGSQNPSPTVSPNASKRRFILDPLI